MKLNDYLELIRAENLDEAAEWWHRHLENTEYLRQALDNYPYQGGDIKIIAANVIRELQGIVDDLNQDEFTWVVFVDIRVIFYIGNQQLKNVIGREHNIPRVPFIYKGSDQEEIIDQLKQDVSTPEGSHMIIQSAMMQIGVNWLDIYAEKFDLSANRIRIIGPFHAIGGDDVTLR